MTACSSRRSDPSRSCAAVGTVAWFRWGAVRTLTALALVVAFSGCATSLSRGEIATEYYNIGSAYFELGELEKSARYLSRAIELEPELARASYNLARVYVIQERYEDALELLARLLEADPENALVMETIGYSHYQADDLTLASEWYDRALEVNPSDPELLQNRAIVALQADEPAVAADALERALRIVDDDASIYLRFARTQRALERPGAAADAYARYLEFAENPEPAALAEYAEVREAQEFYADALSLLDDVIASGGADQQLRTQARFDRARLLLTEAQEAEPGLEALSAALSAGFDDAEQLDALVEHPDLVAASEVGALVDAAMAEAQPDPGAQPETDDELESAEESPSEPDGSSQTSESGSDDRVNEDADAEDAPEPPPEPESP